MRPTLPWRLLLTGLLVIGGTARGQLASTGLPARLPTISSDVERQLAQIDALIAAEAWEEGVDAVLRLQDEANRELMAELSPGHFVPLGHLIGQRIAGWPPEGLAAYRSRVDATARAEFEVAAQARSRSRLARVARDYFASSVGDDALWLLGTLELERGHANAARWCWLRLSPELTAPDGRPWGVALAGADVANPQVWARVERHFPAANDRKARRECYPDTDIPLADIHARLAMASIREQNFARAAAEVALLTHFHGEAQGVVAGREVRLAEALQSTLESARDWPVPAPQNDWPTFAGSHGRASLAAPLGELRGIVWSRGLGERPRDDDSTRTARQIQLNPRFATPQLATPPLEIVGGGGAMVVLKAPQLLALDLTTGKPLFGGSGEVFLEDSLWPPTGLGQSRVRIEDGRRVEIIIRQQAQFQINQRILLNQPLLGMGSRFAPFEVPARGRMVTLADGQVFAVMSPGGNRPANPRQGPPRRLMAFDLAREGKLVLDIPTGGADWQFSGPPIVTDEWVYTAMRQGDSGERLHVACFSRHSGRMAWRQLVATLSTNAALHEEDLLTLDGETLYLNSNAGVVAALGAIDGAALWSHTYAQWNAADPGNAGRQSPRAASPALVADGVVVCLPSDSLGMFALDAATGRPIWFDRHGNGARDLLGVANGTLLSSGSRLLWTDLMTGEARFAWPDSAAAGIESRGRGTIAGGEIFWPTVDGILVFDVATGVQSRRPITLPELDGQLVNLVPLAPYLVVSSSDGIALLGPEGSPPSPPPAPRSPPMSVLPDSDKASWAANP